MRSQSGKQAGQVGVAPEAAQQGPQVSGRGGGLKTHHVLYQNYARRHLQLPSKHAFLTTI